jgi:hypothetical protein
LGSETSLERTTLTYQQPDEAESTLLREFKRRAPIYLPPQHIPGPSQTGDWLALMQHFGAPTRLLDVSRSPFVATYFAVEDASNDVDCALWAFHRKWCLRSAGRFLIGDDEAGGQQDSRELYKRALSYAQGNFLHPGDAALEQVGLQRADLQGKAWSQNVAPVVLPFVPELLNERLSVQQGEFLVPHDVSKSFMDSLANHSDSSSPPTKYTIRSGLRGRILEQFRLMNVTRAQLFPGLDGFAQSFRQLLVEEPYDQRQARWFRITEKRNF